MSLFSHLFSSVKSSIMPGITGFLSGGPMGAAAAIGASALLPKPSTFGTPLGNAVTALGGVGQAWAPVNNMQTPAMGQFNQIVSSRIKGPMLPGKTLPNLGVYPVASKTSALTVYQGGRLSTRFTRQAAEDFYMSQGHPPPGWHNTRTGNIARNRRMNALNPRALGRALRRAHAFAAFAKRVIRVVEHPRGHKWKVGHKRRRKA